MSEYPIEDIPEPAPIGIPDELPTGTEDVDPHIEEPPPIVWPPSGDQS